ncbi:MAG: molybdopterin-dependent oxidoreductase, partial [Desulfohalobium sp.]
MSISRRNFVKGLGAAAALGVFAAGHTPTLKGVAKGWWSKEKPANLLTGLAPAPEYAVDPASGKITVNEKQYVANGMCNGCTTKCGVRVRVDRESGRILRVSGNAYHPLSTEPFIDFNDSIIESYRKLSGYADDGLHYRSVACGRGNAAIDNIYDPYRVRQVLKRTGKRGENKWEPISFEQAIEEIVEGGDLFDEGHVDGLRAIRDLESDVDPDNPEFGKKVNQLVGFMGYKNGRMAFAKRFLVNSFGTFNITGHRGNCGLSMRAGYASLLDDWGSYPHLKPDYREVQYYFTVGSAPNNAGNPFKLQGMLMAEARSEGKLRKLVVVDPVLTNADNLAAGNKVEWVATIPGHDGALVMGMIRWILDNTSYNAQFLRKTTQQAALDAGEPSWSNATHLVVVSEDSPHMGKFLTPAMLGEGGDGAMVQDPGNGKVVPAADLGEGELFATASVETPEGSLEVKSSLQLLREEAFAHSMEEYAEACGLDVGTIARLAREFTSFGRKAAADCHGGTMHSSGYYTAYAVVMLNTLVGNLNWKGGTTAGGGRFKDFTDGPRYDMLGFPGKRGPSGVRLSRRGTAYESTSEYKRKKEAGQNPYPAKAPWFPFSAGLQSEHTNGMVNGYPYPVKAAIFWQSNPIYGQSGLYNHAKETLKDPGKLPLLVGIDPYMTETTLLCDYVFPDITLFEAWGCTAPWAGVLTKTSTVSWPTIDAPIAKTQDGETVTMEAFYIAVAKRMGLAGFGDQAIPDTEGNLHPLHTAADWYLRAFTNIAFDEQPVPDAPDDELTYTGVDRFTKALKTTLKPDEWRKAAYVMCRGGRFESADRAYDGEWLTHRYQKGMQVYNQTVGTNFNSITGQRFRGTPAWVAPAFFDQTPIRQKYPEGQWPFYLTSVKSQLMAPGAAGSDSLHRLHPECMVVMHADDAR